MTMSLTNTEFVTGLVVACGVLIVGLMTAISALVTMFILEWREDRRYLPRHADTLAWPVLLPVSRTPWDRPHPGWDVYPMTAAALQVAALMWAVERAELLHNVPALQPSWVAQAMELCAREAGLSDGRGLAGMAPRGKRAVLREAGQVEPAGRAAGTEPARTSGTDGPSRRAVPAGGLLAAGTSREEHAG